jgi:hypothetical protein
VGKVVQPLQSVNCHDSRAHGHERHVPFTRLVGISGWDLWFGLDLVDLVMVCSSRAHSHVLLCSTAQKMRSMLMKISSRRAKPRVNCLWQDGVHYAV